MTTNSMLQPLMYSMPARWGFEGSISWERLAIAKDPAWYINLQNPSLSNPPYFVQSGFFECAIAQTASDKLQGAWGFINYDQHFLPLVVLYGMTFFMLVALLIVLKRRDPV